MLQDLELVEIEYRDESGGVMPRSQRVIHHSLLQLARLFPADQELPVLFLVNPSHPLVLQVGDRSSGKLVSHAPLDSLSECLRMPRAGEQGILTRVAFRAGFRTDIRIAAETSGGWKIACDIQIGRKAAPTVKPPVPIGVPYDPQTGENHAQDAKRNDRPGMCGPGAKSRMGPRLRITCHR